MLLLQVGALYPYCIWCNLDAHHQQEDDERCIGHEHIGHRLGGLLGEKGSIQRNTPHFRRLRGQAEQEKLSGIWQLNFDQLKAIDSRFDNDIMDVFKFEVSIERKDATGNAAKVAVFNQLKKLAF